uniref:Ladderlectin-like n=1 Tax=Labrus bergylta TaxID=56723 RepID=A0A3Q3GQS9_9LABR
MAYLADVKPVADVGAVADVEIVEDVEALADVAAAVPELQKDNQLEEDELHISEEEYAAMLDVAEIDSPIKERFFSCPSGWERYRSNCYYFVSSSYTWSGAESYCAGRGATMASASDLFEYTFLQSLTSRGGSQTAWMGGYYFQVISLSYINNKKYKYINQSVCNRSLNILYYNTVLYYIYGQTDVCGRFNLLCVHVCRTGGGWTRAASATPTGTLRTVTAATRAFTSRPHVSHNTVICHLKFHLSL